MLELVQHLQRGWQGDPCSPYFKYLMCAEILLSMLSQNNEIKGIKLNETEILLPQFADDTTLCLDGSEQSFNESMHTLQRCVQISGLKMNNRLNQCSLVIMQSFKDLTQTAIVKHQDKPLTPIHRDDQGRNAISEMRGCVNVYSRSI